ncbi:hypothetical protein M413DRAFT_449770 [Hebeloma cylindrosporum]|uniref:Uncharacterized protein n=1 Tax=Hebeloma cylindrosporum TaxID=76867 RepID=A0A0C2XBQ5_HEBCY|nr:hypothetical protein M413DRAFT_449770 [Hebeloma cylindrosporum h7]
MAAFLHFLLSRAVCHVLVSGSVYLVYLLVPLDVFLEYTYVVTISLHHAILRTEPSIDHPSLLIFSVRTSKFFSSQEELRVISNDALTCFWRIPDELSEDIRRLSN